jgi:galactofuranosylgalactofuranosylrhamnosyl-N-acetylglucosaminyl-diphospho-decaprenol beta-1,5/1,6-galactofuranosyltransferase
VTLAMTDFMKGQKFWQQDMELRSKRAEIQGFSIAERMLPIDRRLTQGAVRLSDHEPAGRRLVRMLTLNGFLLPNFMLKGGMVFQHKGFAGSLRNVFRYKHVLFEHEASRTGYTASHDKRRFFSLTLRFFARLILLLIHYKKLRRHYDHALPKMTSEGFWRRIFENELELNAVKPIADQIMEAFVAAPE